MPRKTTANRKKGASRKKSPSRKRAARKKGTARKVTTGKRATKGKKTATGKKASPRKSVPAKTKPKKRKQRSCFVIMPFGTKRATASMKSKRTRTARSKYGSELWEIIGLTEDDKAKIAIDFDALYTQVIKGALRGIQDYEIKVTRCDEIKYSGWIHEKMIEQIATADIAIVDLTTLNPNVFYELGVRHALNECVTVLLQQVGLAERIPFNLGGMSIVRYDPQNLDAAREEIRQTVIMTLARQNHQDSLVFKTLPDLEVSVSKPRPIDKLEFIDFSLGKLHGDERWLGVVTGDIANVRDVDIWVSSENTEMMVARYHEKAISATVRYMGAERDKTGHVRVDVINDALQKEMGGANCVPPGSVVVTTAGKLRETNGVRWIFHAASVLGQIGSGYKPIPNVTSCINNALKMTDSEAFRAEHKKVYDRDVKSIVFPILGTGQAGADPEDTVASLMRTAQAYLERTPGSTLTHVYFLAFTDRDEKVCVRVLESFGLARKQS